MKLFGGGKSDHPMADAREARKILDAIPGADPFKALEDLDHWLESVRTWEGFRPEHRAQLAQLVDEAAQAHLRRLQRDYLSSPRLSRFHEYRLWAAIREWYRRSAIVFATCIDAYVTRQRGWEDLKHGMPVLTVRALHALAAQMKWQYIRYAPSDNFLWGLVARIYAFAENREYARTKVVAYPSIQEETSPEQEFLKAVMMAASSPASLLPAEIELAERLIAHFAGSFKLALEYQPDVAYWIDLAASQPPLRLARPPQRAPTLRFFAASEVLKGLRQLIQTVKSTHAVPPQLGLGGNCEPEIALRVLGHLALYWSPKPPERKAARHRVKSRLAAAHGFDGVLAALATSGEVQFDENRVESWIVENVSAGGFGASVPQIKGEWLKIGSLVGLQPEGGTNWVLGVVRRFHRESLQQGTVGIQTLARAAQAVMVKLQNGQGETGQNAETAILLNPDDTAPEAQLLLRDGVFVAGQNLELERDGKRYLLLSAGVVERGEDYELVRFRRMIRDSGE